MMWPQFSLLLASLPAIVYALAGTDTIQDADAAQSGYLANHNMHPATVGSSIFGFLWKNKYGAKEKWYAQPLVYTPNGGNKTQLVFLASSMNIIRTVDAVTGVSINTRLVQNPFLQSDVGCTDIPDYIGVTGTPIIDPATDIVYFFSKGYRGNATSGGIANGVYNLFAVDINTLLDVPGFPVLIDGHNADSDPSRYFIGGTVLQRPGIALVNNIIIGAFGGHCDLFNYTGMIVGVSTTAGVGVTGLYTMESSPGAPPVQGDITQQVGGKAGIWQGGMGIASDGARIFFATGNGQGHANGQTPSSGRTPLTTLDEVVANFAVSSSGKFSLTDYFEPYEYQTMDAGDRDLGSGGVALLDPTVFNGIGVAQMAVTIGKNGKAYIMNANNLGGFKQGSGGVDNVLQTIVASGSVFGGSGSYPLEGGYIYFTPVGFPTVCFKLGLDSNGKPQFTQVGATARNSAGRVGVGIPVITSYKGQPGTGILWIADPDAGLTAFNAVPDNNGILQPIVNFATGGLNKFQRPAFGDGRLYVSDVNGNVMCLGSPVALPLQCSQPVDFGSVTIGSTATQIVNCTALIPITSINGCTTIDPTFHCQNSSLPLGPVAQGTSFSFPVTWNLTEASINDQPGVSYGKVLPGVKSTSLDIFTTNGVPQYSPQLPISLQGVTVSNDAFLSISPPELDFGGIVVGTGIQQTTLNLIVSNLGSQTLTFTGTAWTQTLSNIMWNNCTADGNGSYITGTAFTSSLLPQLGDTISAGLSITVPMTFTTNSVGTYDSALEFWTTGGNANVLLVGSGSTSPIANISQSKEGGWDYDEPVVMDFGNVLAGTTQIKTLRICNSGGSALEITKSKPPIQVELTAANPSTDLHEGQFIDVNTCASAEMDIIASPLGVNRPPHTVSDVWILNTNDLTFGVHDVAVTANIVTRQVGPLMPDGVTAKYTYLGCYFDGTRQLQKIYTNKTMNENGWCQNLCSSYGYKFAGTEYSSECWCGNNPPHVSVYTPDSAKMCTLACAADSTQACGGTGTYISIYYDQTQYTPDSNAIPNAPSASATVSTTVTATGVTTGTTTATTGATSATAAAPTPTGPIIVPSVGAYKYVGCYSEAVTGRALSSKSYANDSMTIEICAAFCSTYTWWGVEYARECYCGNSPNAGSALGSTACTLTCKGNSTEMCGGSKALQMYNNLAAVSLSTTSTAPYSSMTSTASSSASLTSSATSTTSTSSAVLSSSTTSTSSSSSLTTSITSTISPSSTASTISSSSTTSTTSSSSTILTALSTTTTSTSTTSTSSPSSSSTSSSSTSSMTSTTLLTTISASTTSSSSSSTAPSTIGISNFYPQGCFSDPAGGPFTGHNMPLLFTNSTGMTVDQCISSALARLTAVPATTYLYVGLEYGRECYVATAPPTPEPTSLVGPKACTMTCKGNAAEKCGGSNMYNLYASGVAVVTGAATGTGTATGIWSSAPAVSTK